MSKAIAFLAGMGTGYLNADRQKKQDERQAKFDKITFDEAQARADDRTEGKANRDAIRTAAAPVKVEQAVDLPDNRDIGQPGETAPVPFYRAGAKRFAEQGLADTEAAAQNTPQATRGRVYSALAQQDPVRADQYRASGVQADAAEATLAAATKQREQQEKVQDIVGTLATGGVSAIPGIYARYNDGFTAQVVENPKGGFAVTRVGPDGKPAGTTEFKSVEDFISRAVARMNPELYMTQAQRQRELDQKQSNDDRDHGLKKDTQTEVGRHNKAMEDIYGVKADAYADKLDRTGTAPPAVAPVWDSKADDFLKQRYTVKDELTGATSVDGHGLQFAKQVALAQARRNGGDTTTALGYAFDIDAKIKAEAKGDPVKVRAMRDNLTRQMMAAPAAAPAAAPRPVNAAAIAAAAPAAPSGMANMIPGAGGVKAPPAMAAAPAPTAPAAQPAKLPFQQFLGSNIQTPQGKQAILRRVRTDLPMLQQQIAADTAVLKTPGLTPQAKQTLQVRIDQNLAEAQMMQRFVDGNPGLTP